MLVSCEFTRLFWASLTSSILRQIFEDNNAGEKADVSFLVLETVAVTGSERRPLVAVTLDVGEVFGLKLSRSF